MNEAGENKMTLKAYAAAPGLPAAVRDEGFWCFCFYVCFSFLLFLQMNILGRESPPSASQCLVSLLEWLYLQDLYMQYL